MTFPITCIECGQDAESTVRHAKRCPPCAAERKRKGSPGRHSKTAAGKHQAPSYKAGKRRAQSRQTHQAIANRRWWGIDGEGVNRGDRHEYVFLAAASNDGQVETLYQGGARLRTHDMLWFLWTLGRPGDQLCWYSAGYDWTMIFQDIEPEVLADIYSDEGDAFEPIWWEGWGITYIKGAVTLSRQNPDSDKVTERFYADMWRCLGAGSFVNAITAWDIATPDELTLIERMKAKRSTFEHFDDEIRDYCLMECRLLANLASKATTAASEVNIRPSRARWYSAGSAAKALMRHHKVKDYRGPDRWAGAPEHLQVPIASAYFGGRFETTLSGLVPEAHVYDLASAYPAIMTTLPCLEHGTWQAGRHGPWCIERVYWHPTQGSEGVPWGPLPYRTADGHIWYPLAGAGWYWSVEVEAATRLDGYDIECSEPWSWVPSCDHQPFEWVADTYQERLELGKGSKGLMLKVAMNSCYGTTADTVSDESAMSLFSSVWAGLITASTRAKLMNVISEHPNEVFQVATDSVICLEPIMGDKVTKTLGGWDYEGLNHNFFVIQPGVYWSDEIAGKTRGHSAKDIEMLMPRLLDTWAKDGFNGEVTYPRTRFIPARLALHRKDWSCYGQWQTSNATIKFRPSSRLAIPSPGTYSRTWPLPITGGNTLSAPYDKLVSKLTNAESHAEDILEQDQP